MQQRDMIPKEDCRNHKALKRVLTSHLDYFERLTNWAEMADWLQKLARHIETYDTLYLPCKKAIAKRLNQCLNIPNLPIGIHRTNMTIYDLVFDILSKRKSALAKNIAIFSFGLFSMFKKAQLEIKHSIIGLFEKYYLPMQEQLVPMLNGLIGCLLSGMNDSETEMKSKILKLLIKINACVGDHVYMSALWQVLLKNSQTQIQCIKALVHKLEKSKDKLKLFRKSVDDSNLVRDSDNPSLVLPDDQDPKIQIPKKTTMPKFPGKSVRELTPEDLEKRRLAFQKMVGDLKKGDEEDVRVNFFPNNCMVVNAVIKCLENPDVHVVKGILDLLIAYIGFKKESSILNSTEMIAILVALLRVLKDHDTSVRRRVYQLLFLNKELSKVSIDSPHCQHILELMCTAYEYYLNFNRLNEEEINLIFDIIDIFNEQRKEVAMTILSKNAYKFVQFVYLLGYQTANEFTTLVIQRLKKFIVASSQYIEEIIESLAVVIHENSQRIATELSKSNKKMETDGMGISQIEKMFIIEFVVKIIINESDISIMKKREYMLLMLRSLLSMFNLFEGGVTHSEKDSFVKLLDMISQLLLFLKTEFKIHTDKFLGIWTSKGLFLDKPSGLELSELVLKKLAESEEILNGRERKETFLKTLRDMMDNQGSKRHVMMQTRVICESEYGMKKLNQKRRSILQNENPLGTGLDMMISDQFIATETFENECRVVFNLIINNCHSTIILNNFQKLICMLLQMEELTVFGVLSNFQMKNILSDAKERSSALKPFSKNSRSHKSRITRFTDLTIPHFGSSSLFKDKSQYREKDFLDEDLTDPPAEGDMSKKKQPETVDAQSQLDLSNLTKKGFPNWLLSCLEIIRQSDVEPLVFKVMEFLYFLLDWEKSSTFTLSVRYNNLLYKDRRNFAEEGIFPVILKRLFDLMEVSAYKKVGLNYFMSFVLENCDFVIQFIRKKLAQSTARDFRQIASLWKNTSQLNSTTIRKLLSETVFDMLNYADREDPLVRNYFKNWLQFSQKNFYLIVNKLLKKLYLHTNMKVVRGRIVYNYLYRTEQFQSLLRLLKSVLTNGGNSFINFIRKTQISSEFEVYDTEMNTILNGFYGNASKKYYAFIVKLLLCYLLSHPNQDLFSQFISEADKPDSHDISSISMNTSKRKHATLSNKATRIFSNQQFSSNFYNEGSEDEKLTQREHQHLTDCMKESICLFIEQLFESMNNDEDFEIAMSSQNLLRPISYNLEQVIQSGSITLQLEYLNLLHFLMFKTKFAKSLGPLNIEKRLVEESDMGKIRAFAENFTDIGIEDRDFEESSKKGDKKSSRKSKKKKRKDSKMPERPKDEAFVQNGVRLLENLKKILTKGDYLKILLKGLNNEHTFVMAKYLEEINRLMFMYTKLFSDEILLKALKDILFTYLTLIFENGVTNGPLKDLEKRKEKVISLLKGMRFFLEQVLQFTHVEIKNERNVEKAFIAIFTLGIMSQRDSGRKKMVFKLEESTCMALIDSFPKLFNKLIQTYRLTAIIADADVYRMLRDPSFSMLNPNEPVDVEQVTNVKHSLAESVIEKSIFESGAMSIYKSNNLYNNDVADEEEFGVLTHTEFAAENLSGISKNVFKILNPLCNNFVMKTCEAFLENWIQCNQTSVGLSGLDLLDFSTNNPGKYQSNNMKSSQMLHGGLREEDIMRSDLHIKILEILLYNNIDPERVLKGIDYSYHMKEIREMQKNSSSSKFSKKIYFWTEYAQAETNVLSFLFAYLKYCCSPRNFFDKEQRKHNSNRMTSFSSVLLGLLKTFENSENTTTYMWILDIVSVFLDKFSNLNNFLGKSRNEWRTFISDLWTRIGKIVSDDFSFEFKGEGSSSKNPSMTKGVVFPIRPLNPSLRAASGSVQMKLAKHFRGTEEEKDKMFDYVKYRDKQTNILRYKYFLLISLKKSLYQTCEFFLSSSKSGSSKNISINSSLILQNSADQLKLSSIMEGSSVWNMVRLRPLIEKLLGILRVRKASSLIHQEISEILVILTINRSFLGDFKQDLLDIFDSDEFFKCDVKTLKMWSKIIDQVLDFSKNTVIVDSYMRNIDFKGVFVFKDTENKKRMKSFLRICFIIYSGDAEKYIDKRALKTLLEKIKNLLKEENTDPRLTILILFSLRILIMRLQQSTLNELFKTIWPSIIFLLRKLIKSKNEQHQNIFLASMKLLELISSTDIEEFNLHKWSFMFEYFGVELSLVDAQFTNSQLIHRNQGSFESTPHVMASESGEELVGFHVNPFLMAKMPANTLIRYRLKNPTEVNTYSTYNTTEVIKKRKVVITENSLKEIKLEHKIHQFLTYSVQSSRMDMQIDKEDLECVIEKDFIDFGAYLLS